MESGTILMRATTTLMLSVDLDPKVTVSRFCRFSLCTSMFDSSLVRLHGVHLFRNLFGNVHRYSQNAIDR